MQQVKDWARRIKRDVIALYIAGRDPRTPWVAKALAVAVVAYALSPIDLIPDFIPIIGYLDDLLIVPLGIVLVVSLIPPELMAEYRQAAEARAKPQASRSGAIVVIVIWLVLFALVLWWAVGLFGNPA